MMPRPAVSWFGLFRSTAFVAGLACSSITTFTQTPRPAKFPATAVKKSDYRLFRPPSPLFTVEIPRRNWKVAPGYGASLVLLVSDNADATVGIEHVKLTIPLADEDIGDTFVGYEMEGLKAAWPTATTVAATVLRSDAGAVVVFDFTHQSALGVQQVRQYSLPRRDHLYRVACTAASSAFSRFVPTFEYIAASLKPEEAQAARP